MQVVSDFIKFLLHEDKYRKMTGQHFDMTQLYADKVVGSGDKTTLFFTMTYLPKVGIKPTSQVQFEHDDWRELTPLGVFAYPLNETCWNQLLTNKLPYVSSMPYVSFLKMVDNQHAMVLDEFNNLEKYRNIQKSCNANIKTFRSMLIQSGVTSVHDFMGSGYIHENEQYQSCFLTADSYKVLNTYNVSDFRKDYTLFPHNNGADFVMYITHLSEKGYLRPNEIKFFIKHADISKIDRFLTRNYRVFADFETASLILQCFLQRFLTNCQNCYAYAIEQIFDVPMTDSEKSALGSKLAALLWDKVESQPKDVARMLSSFRLSFYNQFYDIFNEVHTEAIMRIGAQQHAV